jgi:hypothetical protein
MRLHLRVVPFEEAPAEVKGLAVADDVDDFTLPVYWVNGFEHDEAGLRVAEDPGRLQFANRLPHSVVKVQTDKVPAGEERPPFYFYGGDWGVYAPGAEDVLVQETPGGVRSAVRSFHRLLQARGIRLIFVPVPQSASLYPDVGLGGFEGNVLQREPANGAVGELLKALQADGVTVCDLTEHFRNHRLYEHEGRSYPAWISNDTHWSSWASAEAARVVAEMIAKAKVLKAAEAVRLPASSFNTAWHPLQHRGDMESVEAAKSLGVIIPPVPAMELRVVPAVQGAAAILDVAPDTAPVHVVGDSFLGIWAADHAGFRAHLVKQLGVPVHAVTVNGSGNRGAPHTWWKGSRDSAPKVVVWICAERMLPEPQWYGDGEME